MNQERLLTVILSSHVSEKATTETEKRSRYVFKVASFATKPDIKEAVEYLFHTKVQAVHIVKVKPKRRWFKGVEGKRKGWKKAYVTLQADQKLDLAGA